MPFPFTHKNGGICCSTSDAMCDSCKAKVAAKARAAVTPTVTRRSASSVGEPGASVAIEEEIEHWDTSTANGRYQATLSATFANLRAATRALEADRAAHPPTMRTLEAPEDVPDPYAAALGNRAPVQSDLTSDMDPNYQPYGTPPDSYKLAFALRQLNAQEAK